MSWHLTGLGMLMGALAWLLVRMWTSELVRSGRTDRRRREHDGDGSDPGA
jgi:hypothetical protein